MTDDQTQASLALMPPVQSRARRAGRHLRQQLHQLAAVLPLAGDLLHRPVRAQPRRARQPAARRRLRPASTTRARCRSGSRRAGYRTIHIGKYLNGYGEGANDSGLRAARAGTSGTRPPPARRRRVYDYTLNQNGSLVNYGTAVDRLQAGRVHRHRRRRDQPQRAGRAVLHGRSCTPRPHAGGPNPNPNPPTNCSNSAKPAPRHATAFDSEPLPHAAELQRGRRLRQAGGDPGDAADRPTADFDQHPAPLPLPDRVAALGRRGRRADRRRARGRRRARRTR